MLLSVGNTLTLFLLTVAKIWDGCCCDTVTTSAPDLRPLNKVCVSPWQFHMGIIAAILSPGSKGLSSG
uniref:Putative secreted protein n=1 Tax=Panstrongylus lignarius TaxID=156445 RepID=A0A224Y5H6_9HEMI